MLISLTAPVRACVCVCIYANITYTLKIHMCGIYVYTNICKNICTYACMYVSLLVGCIIPHRKYLLNV